MAGLLLKRKIYRYNCQLLQDWITKLKRMYHFSTLFAVDLGIPRYILFMEIKFTYYILYFIALNIEKVWFYVKKYWSPSSKKVFVCLKESVCLFGGLTNVRAVINS